VSTWLYLKCESHDPPILADDESGQHLSDLPQVQDDVHNKEFIVGVYEDGWRSDDRYRNNTARFLSQHPRCKIVIQDEYGETYPSSGYRQ
jgi:hypothetical protein